MNTKHAILWDLDGTLIDTKESHFNSWHRTLQTYGFELNIDILHMNFGRNNKVIVPLLLGFQPDEHLLDKIIEEKELDYLKTATQLSTLIPGVETWLSTAAEMKIKQAIASSGPLVNIKFMLESFNLSRFFNTIVSGTNLPAKPEPDIFFKAAQELDCLPENCLVIEDAIAGVEGAKNAGMKCVAVTTSHANDELTLADLIIDDFTVPLLEILSSLNWV